MFLKIWIIFHIIFLLIQKITAKYLIINEYGIENFAPLRQKYDGITKFGACIYNNENKNPINDFQIFSLEKDIQTILMIKNDSNKKKIFLILILIIKLIFKI